MLTCTFSSLLLSMLSVFLLWTLTIGNCLSDPLAWVWDRVICHKAHDRWTVCLPIAGVWHIADWVNRFLGGTGDDPAVKESLDLNYKFRGRWSFFQHGFRGMDSKLKKRTCKLVFSEILCHQPLQRCSGSLEKWKNSWQTGVRKRGLENWTDFFCLLSVRQ